MTKDLNMNVRIADSDSMHRFNWNWNLSDLENIKKNGFKVFSCFACGGGSSMGYKLAGFDVVGCNEIDPRMNDVYIENNHPKYNYLEDIRTFAKRDDFPEELLDLDVLDGSPPCSTFSMAGKRENDWNKEKKFREGQKEQRLDDLFFAFIEAAKNLQPKIVVAENVKGLILKNARGYVNEIIKAFNEANYDVQIFLLNSAKMGVPQKRERVFFIARRKDLGLPEIRLNFNEPIILFKDIKTKKGIKASDGIQGTLLKYRKNSDRSLADISKRTRRKYAGYTARILADDRVANTITAGGEIFRASDGMKLSDRDVINAQTFPQDYNFKGNGVQYICGMSVPPVMIANIAKEIELQLLNNRIGGKHGKR